MQHNQAHRHSGLHAHLASFPSVHAAVSIPHSSQYLNTTSFLTLSCFCWFTLTQLYILVIISFCKTNFPLTPPSPTLPSIPLFSYEIFSSHHSRFSYKFYPPVTLSHHSEINGLAGGLVDDCVVYMELAPMSHFA
jgi:hypothetical protein